MVAGILQSELSRFLNENGDVADRILAKVAAAVKARGGKCTE
jgi:DNA gyrase/topoisomerase IV subunit B